MGIIRTIASSVGSMLGNTVGDRIGQRIEAYLSSSEESDEADESDEGESGQSRRAAFVDRLRSRLLSARAKVDELQSEDEGDGNEEEDERDGADEEEDDEDEGSEEEEKPEEENGEENEGQTHGIGARVSNALPDTDQLGQTVTDVMGEVSEGTESGERAEDGDEPSPSTAGQQLGETVGRQIGNVITRALRGDSDEEESTES